MTKLKAMRSVYAYYFPEIRKLIDQMVKNYPHRVFLQSISPGLDDFHFGVIKKYEKYIVDYLPALSDFNYRYFTNGSSEGIFHLLIYLKMNFDNPLIYVWKGEYEGYVQYAKELDLKVIEVDFEADPKRLPTGFWFISNPSARNGSIIANEKIDEICQANHKVIIDCAYVGLTKRYAFDISHPNIIAVITSLSKPLGLFYYRIGFTFSREQIKTLFPNIWFKNIFSLLIAEKVFSTFKADYFYNKYRKTQLKIIGEINKETGLRIKPSDALLLGYLDRKGISENKLAEIERFKRGDYFRFCLTPYFLSLEKIVCKNTL